MGTVKRMRVFRLAAFLVLSFPVFAGYDANITGKVTQVLTYTTHDSILIRLDNQPATHPVCKTDFFELDESIPAERRGIIMSRLLLARANGETLNIGFDKSGGCGKQGRIRVYRVG